MINGEWLVLFALVWTPYLSMTEANFVRGVHGTDGSIKETLCVKHKAKMRPQTQFFTHILEREMPHANNRSFREASARQNVSTNIPREKLEKWLSCLLHKLKLSNGTKDSWLSYKIVKIIHDAPLLKTKDTSSCNQMKQITFTWMLTSDLNDNEIKWKKLHTSDSNDSAFHLSDSYLMVVRRKVCDEWRGLYCRTLQYFSPADQSCEICIKCELFLQSWLKDKHCAHATIIVYYCQLVNQQGPSVTHKHDPLVLYSISLHKQSRTSQTFPIRQNLHCSSIWSNNISTKNALR